MSRKGRRVSFSPDVNDKPIVEVGRQIKKNEIRSWSLPIKDSAAISGIKVIISGLKTKMGKGICSFVYSNRSSSSSSSKSKVSSSINSNLTKSRSLSDDSHRAQALEDCILFLNNNSSSSSSSSNMKRTNSVSSNSC